MLTIDPTKVDTPVLQRHLQSAVAPRPIAFASTVDAAGRVNLSPFSFFNVFSSNPPILVFSPSRRGRDNTTKDTLHNVQATGEVVINVVNYALVQQASLSSTEYPSDVSEFVKAGLTPIPSEKVAPPRVEESPVQMECKMKEIIPLGDQGGAGNLVICEIVRIHIREEVLDENGFIDQDKIDLVARLGNNWYSRNSGDALFEVEKPLRNMGMGVDNIPNRIRNSYIFDGNDLGKLGNVEKLPEMNEVEVFSKEREIRDILEQGSDGMEIRENLYLHAKELLDRNQVINAWKTLLCDKLTRQ